MSSSWVARVAVAVSAILGIILLGYNFVGFWSPQRNLWARRFFLYTLIYLTALFAVIVIDAGPSGPDHPLPPPPLPDLSPVVMDLSTR